MMKLALTTVDVGSDLPLRHMFDDRDGPKAYRMEYDTNTGICDVEYFNTLSEADEFVKIAGHLSMDVSLRIETVGQYQQRYFEFHKS